MNERPLTFCEDCDNVHPDTRKRSPSSWLCIKFPRVEGGGFVAPKVWAREEPFLKCINCNGGACPFFTRRREGQREMGLGQ
jgi:hypothetical protein